MRSNRSKKFFIFLLFVRCFINISCVGWIQDSGGNVIFPITFLSNVSIFFIDVGSLYLLYICIRLFSGYEYTSKIKKNILFMYFLTVVWFAILELLNNTDGDIVIINNKAIIIIILRSVLMLSILGCFLESQALTEHIVNLNIIIRILIYSSCLVISVFGIIFFVSILNNDNNWIIYLGSYDTNIYWNSKDSLIEKVIFILKDIFFYMEYE